MSTGSFVPPYTSPSANTPVYSRTPTYSAGSPYVSSDVPLMQTPIANSKGVVQSTVDGINKGVDQVTDKVKHSGVWNLVILIVVITIVYMVLFWLLRLPIVLTTNAAGALTTDVSFWKLLGTSFVGSLITVFIIWGISKLTRK